jgi:hypothetical protein
MVVVTFTLLDPRAALYVVFRRLNQGRYLPNLALWDQGGAQARRAGGRPAAPLTAAARHPH